MTKMNPDIKSEFVAALRSGEYPQGRGRLHPGGNGYCCLGVLCDLYAKHHSDKSNWGGAYGSTFFFGGAFFNSMPPREVYEWAGLPEDATVLIDNETGELQQHNDGYTPIHPKTFAEIADAVEEQL